MAEAATFVSLRLVARAADMPVTAVKRIAAEVAKGRRTTWLGAAIEVRTHNQGRGRHRDIALASLPEAVRAELESDRLRFLVAAEHPEPGAELHSHDFRLLHRAAHSGIATDQFRALVDFLCNGGPLVRASRARFDQIMDRLFGFGFRDPVLIEVGADYLAFLEERRQVLGINDDAFGTILIEHGAVHYGCPRAALLTGYGFLRVLQQIHGSRGQRVPELPARHIVGRTTIGLIHAAVAALKVPYDEHLAVIAAFGGGCLRARDLDLRGAQRVLSFYIARGFIPPEPPLRVSGLPCYISQPQANLISKLMRDLGCVDAAAMETCFREINGLGGDWSTLTANGAARVIDGLLAPIIAAHVASETA